MCFIKDGKDTKENPQADTVVVIIFNRNLHLTNVPNVYEVMNELDTVLVLVKMTIQHFKLPAQLPTQSVDIDSVVRERTDRSWKEATVIRPLYDRILVVTQARNCNVIDEDFSSRDLCVLLHFSGCEERHCRWANRCERHRDAGFVYKVASCLKSDGILGNEVNMKSLRVTGRLLLKKSAEGEQRLIKEMKACPDIAAGGWRWSEGDDNRS